jgi:hypothetical protein
VRAVDGNRTAKLRRNLTITDRVDVVDSRARRTGYWQQSVLTGNWHRYDTDGRRLETAEKVE